MALWARTIQYKRRHERVAGRARGVVRGVPVRRALSKYKDKVLRGRGGRWRGCMIADRVSALSRQCLHNSALARACRWRTAGRGHSRPGAWRACDVFVSVRSAAPLPLHTHVRSPTQRPTSSSACGCNPASVGQRPRPPLAASSRAARWTRARTSEPTAEKTCIN